MPNGTHHVHRVVFTLARLSPPGAFVVVVHAEARVKKFLEIIARDLLFIVVGCACTRLGV
eukprot:359833-Chlamydomonas_euryale.AAC.7